MMIISQEKMMNKKLSDIFLIYKIKLKKTLIFPFFITSLYSICEFKIHFIEMLFDSDISTIL